MGRSLAVYILAPPSPNTPLPPFLFFLSLSLIYSPEVNNVIYNTIPDPPSIVHHTNHCIFSEPGFLVVLKLAPLAAELEEIYNCEDCAFAGVLYPNGHRWQHVNGALRSWTVHFQY